MAEERAARRSYRPAGGEDNGADVPRAATVAPPAPVYEKKTTFAKGNFIPITGLFKSKSGKADTVFVTEKIVQALQDIRPGDTMGVSINQKNRNLSLWYIAKED